MGGEDVGSDDEYYLDPLRANSDDDDDASTNGEREVDLVEKNENNVGRKRISKDSDETSPASGVSKKRKRADVNSLQGLGKGIRKTPLEIQAKLLTEFSGITFSPQHIGRSKEAQLDDKDELGIAKRIQAIVSKKKLKKWKEKESPAVIIICLSARRAVQLLKELAPLNVRAAKLFAKHITIEDQVKQLEESSFGIAVGTPHRILTLAKQGALSFEKTMCVALDTALNDKKFSVYTLPDTAPHTQALLKEFVQPECRKRRDMRLAFI